ncbi:DUF4336 domain-containing protein [Rhodanobacter sp. Col0626]|uniref:DUF4336 domain-containing protein n=1 Tax=Rhodanobacter sp. Col0626 TaxID=3415679 RepID=UPI003CE97577
MQLTEFIPDQIWLLDYPVKYAGCRFYARMSIVRLANDALMLHSPCEMDDAIAHAISRLGLVSCIVAPGSFHYMYVAKAQSRFPAAQTYLCPGVERKVPGLRFDWILGDRPPTDWVGTMDQVLIRGCRFMWEVAMLHKPSKTLLLVDAMENFTDKTADVGWQVKAWFKLFGMWNMPKPAPEYRLGWSDKVAARSSLEKILDWDFDRIVLSHGDNITENAKEQARRAWTPPLK